MAAMVILILTRCTVENQVYQEIRIDTNMCGCLVVLVAAGQNLALSTNIRKTVLNEDNMN